MTRHHVEFECDGDKLIGTIDGGTEDTGLLIVSGGNEIRSGAFSGQAALAAVINAVGYPVFRFDRRGVGDSEGENLGFRRAGRDIECALDAFRRRAPHLNRIVAFGNCDAASSLMLSGGSGCDGLVLSNPWTVEEDEDPSAGMAMTPEMITARYWSKLRDPREMLRLLRGGVNLKKLSRGLLAATRPATPKPALAEEMRTGLDAFEGPVRILIATADRTARVFESNWQKDDLRILRCEGAGHAYVEQAHREWLEKQVLSALRD